MFFTWVPGLMPHIVWQYGKGCAYLTAMFSLIWFLPQSTAYFYTLVSGLPVPQELNSGLFGGLLFSWLCIGAVLHIFIRATMDGRAHRSRCDVHPEEIAPQVVVARARLGRLTKRAGLTSAPSLVVFCNETGISDIESQVFVTRSLPKVIGVSPSFIEYVDPDDQEPLFAHELAHVKHGDIETALLLLVGGNVLRGYIALAFLLSPSVFFLGRPLHELGFFFVAGIMAFGHLMLYCLLYNAHSRCREYLADAGGIGILGWDQRLNFMTSYFTTLFLRGAPCGLPVSEMVSTPKFFCFYETHPDDIARANALRISVVLAHNEVTLTDNG